MVLAIFLLACALTLAIACFAYVAGRIIGRMEFIDEVEADAEEWGDYRADISPGVIRFNQEFGPDAPPLSFKTPINSRDYE